MKDNSNINVLDSLKSSIDIDGHLSFVNSLLDKYSWEGVKKKNILTFLNLISEKQNDTNLYLGVIGEFTSGKSTFINSLISDDLLKADVLPETTASATLIVYNEELDVEVAYSNGNKVTYRKNLTLGKKIWRSLFPPNEEKIKNEIKEYICDVTTNEEFAKNIDSVKIKHPSKVLKEGLIIIDTPGTNVDNKRHEEVTKNAIREMCDAAVIIMPSTKTVSQSMIGFIENNIKDIISRCIFVVTKMDLLKPKERQGVLDYIKQQLKNNFNIPNVYVLPSTPLLALSDKMNTVCGISISEEERQVLLEETYKTEDEIYNILREQRVLIQLQKLATLINTMFVDLESDLKAFEISYDEKHSALEKNKIKDLSSFVQEQKNKHAHAIKQNSISLQEEVLNLVDSSKGKLIDNIRIEIYNTKNGSQLGAFVKRRLKGIVNSMEIELQNNLTGKFQEFEAIGVKQVVIFEEEFKKIYMSLATLGGKINIDEIILESKTSSTLAKSFKEEISSVKGEVNSYNGKVTMASFGGAGAGAAIGTMIFPGVGTAVGFFAGLFAGLIFSKPLNELQDKYFNDIKKGIDASFDSALNAVNASAELAINNVINDMNGIIDNYFNQYNNLIRDMIRQDEDEKILLKNKSKMIREDLSQLSNRQSTLEGLTKELVSYFS